METFVEMVSGGFTNASVPDHPRAFGFTIYSITIIPAEFFLFWVFYLEYGQVSLKKSAGQVMQCPHCLRLKMLCRRESSWFALGDCGIYRD